MIISDRKGAYLSPKNCMDGDMITLLDSGEIVENTKFPYPDGKPKMDFIFKVEHCGEAKQYRMNKMSRGSCVEAWGKDTEAWVGKIGTINIFPTPNGDTKMIVLKPTGTQKRVDLPKDLEDDQWPNPFKK